MSRPVWLDPDNLGFPSPVLAARDPEGLLAAGGDLRPERLLAAYRRGIFPWYEDGGPLLWWSPDPRMVLHPADVHVSRSMARLARQNRYQLTMDRAFPAVIDQCSALRRAPLDGSVEEAVSGTWITADMIAAYTTLHHLGYAHSVEVWDGEQLAGGLYGISLGGLFFGESMFSLQPNTSKLAFIALAEQLQQWHFSLIDCQLPTDHLHSLGAVPIPRLRFLQALEIGLKEETRRGAWTFDIVPATR